ncbi:MAG: hypothetical protein PHY29_05735 [Syntrophales bacterium]|nr:hypothetical protein [Syntrophales bacterium]
MRRNSHTPTGTVPPAGTPRKRAAAAKAHPRGKASPVVVEAHQGNKHRRRPDIPRDADEDRSRDKGGEHPDTSSLCNRFVMRTSFV